MAHVDFFKTWAFGCRVFAHDDVNVKDSLAVHVLLFQFSRNGMDMSMRCTCFKALATFSIDVDIFQGLEYKGS